MLPRLLLTCLLSIAAPLTAVAGPIGAHGIATARILAPASVTGLIAQPARRSGDTTALVSMGRSTGLSSGSRSQDVSELGISFTLSGASSEHSTISLPQELVLRDEVGNRQLSLSKLVALDRSQRSHSTAADTFQSRRFVLDGRLEAVPALSAGTYRMTLPILVVQE